MTFSSASRANAKDGVGVYVQVISVEGKGYLPVFGIALMGDKDVVSIEAIRSLAASLGLALRKLTQIIQALEDE